MNESNCYSLIPAVLQYHKMQYIFNTFLTAFGIRGVYELLKIKLVLAIE